MLLTHESRKRFQIIEPSRSRSGKRASLSKNIQARELSLEKVAKAVNISPNHLSEKFKQVTGINFVEYVARTRFENACDLLRNPNLRISEIAFAAGFQSLSQFNRVFKKLARKSPIAIPRREGSVRREYGRISIVHQE